MYDILSNITGIVCNLCTGIVGAIIFTHLKVPIPVFTGAIFMSCISNIFGFCHELHYVTQISMVANVFIGMTIGRLFDRSLITNFKKVIVLVAVSSIGFILLSLVCGVVFFKMSNLDIKTALISTATGGTTEMTAFGMSLGANTTIIATTQIFRLITFFTIIPFIKIFDKEKDNCDKQKLVARPKYTNSFDKIDYIAMFLISYMCGSIFKALNIPNGAMIGGMLGTGIYCICKQKNCSNFKTILDIAQLWLGVVMGNGITVEFIHDLSKIIIPTIIMTFVMLLGSLILAYIIGKISNLDRITCLLCAAPAGISQITVFAQEVGADVLVASIFHFFRVFCIVSFYPSIILFINMYL